jgi:hypothetical protein
MAPPLQSQAGMRHALLAVLLAACGATDDDDPMTGDDEPGGLTAAEEHELVCRDACEARAALGCPCDGGPDMCAAETALQERAGCLAESQAWFECIGSAAECEDDCDWQPSLDCLIDYCMDHPEDPDCPGPPPPP